MKKHITQMGLILLFIIFFVNTSIFAQNANPLNVNTMEKWELYNYLSDQRGYELKLQKTSAPEDRKRSILNVGNVVARIRNAATLGYDRDGKCYEFPAGSGITYRWTMAPLVGYIKEDGTKVLASGTYGAARGHEDEFEPIGGLDAGWSDSPINNYGIAASDRPDTWPSSWPTDQYMPAVGETGFPGIKNGQVVATRELYFAVTDASNNVSPGNMRIDMWGIQYEDFINEDFINEDFIIYKMIVTNIGDSVMHDVYIGMHDDPDTPEQGASEWTDDFAAFIPVDADVEGYEAHEDTLLWNLAYLWDGDDRVEGLIASKVAWVGLKVLETPEDPTNPGTQLGLTTMDVFEYSNAPQTEITEYDQLASGIKPPDNVEPHPEDWTQSPNTYGPDITYAFASGPFELQPGEQLSFTMASVHGVNKKDLFNNAMLCQILYNNDYRAAEGPPEPELKAHVGDHTVTLYWDAYPTEDAVYFGLDGGIDHVGDKLTGNNTFEGYKIYKSMDRGVTWGEAMIDVSGAPRGYIPLAQFDLANGIAGESETRPFFWLGDDSGLKHSYTDNNVRNGYEYWYAVLAYDSDDGPIPPLENAFKRDANMPGDNVIAVIPKGKVSSFKSGYADSAAAHTAGISDIASFEIEVVDPSAITGDSYEISFVDSTAEKTFTITTTENTIPKAGAVEVKDWAFYSAALDNAPIFDGLTLKITDVAWGWKSAEWTTGNTDAIVEQHWWGYYDVGTTDDYEIRWTGAFGDSGLYGSNPLPFEIYNLTQNAACAHYTWDDDGSGDWTPDDRVMVVEPDGNWTWVFYVIPEGGDIPTPPVAGDVFTIITNKSLTSADKYQFSTSKETYQGVKESDLKKITTVPNPYVVSSRFEVEAFGIQKAVQFHFLPPKCTIKIFNLAGDLIQTLNHENGTSVEIWDLQSYNQQEIAFGVYFYHIDAPGIGKHIGKMAIIK